MSEIAFATLTAAERLQASGFDQQQARALVEMQRLAMLDLEKSRELATKKDIMELRMELRVEMGNFRAEMSNLRSEMIRWMVSCNLALGAFLVAVMAWLKWPYCPLIVGKMI